MIALQMTPALCESDFLEWLKREGQSGYHDRHPFHLLMHDGRLTKLQLQQWVVNRYYYQTRIPIKDALILSKSEDPSFRRKWIQRIRYHDGEDDDSGGLALWLRLAEGVGLDIEEVRSCDSVLPGVRLVCNRYVGLVQKLTLVEAVALSLTELFAPDLMAKRLVAWEQHYQWIDVQALEYFRCRISQAKLDAKEALNFVLSEATSYKLQVRCVQALRAKTKILWEVLDCLYTAYVEPG